jgi:hypothetical protein
VVCIRRAWLVLEGRPTQPLEDEAATYSCTTLDLGYPEVREVVNNRPDVDGTDDRTRLFGSRAISADIHAQAGVLTCDEIADLFAPYMVASARPELHYVLDRPGQPERMVTVRAAGFTAPISGKATWEIHLAFVAPDPVMRDPTERSAIARVGSDDPGGRGYPLTFPRYYSAGGGGPTTGEIMSPGDVPVRPLLRIYGPVTDPVVKLAPTLQQPPVEYRVAFVAGFRIASGAWVDVDTDRRTVMDSTGASLMAQLDWAATTWPVLPDLPAVTYLTVTGTSATGISQVLALWQDGYLT